MSDCELLLVGERPTDGTAVVLRSEDGGRTLAIRAALAARRLWRVLTLNNDLWVLGEDSAGRSILFRSNDRAQSWSSIALPAPAGLEIASSEGRLVVSGSTDILVGDGTNWASVLSLPTSARLGALAAGGRVVAVGGVDQSRWLVYVSADAAVTFKAVGLPSAYDPSAHNAVSGLAVSDGARVIIGGYSGKRVENGTAVASRLDVATGVLEQLDVPPAVQLLRPVCTPAFCLGITPTGRSDLGDMIVRLQGTAGRWERMSTETPSVPVFLERIFVGPTSAYAVGSALMRAQP